MSMWDTKPDRIADLKKEAADAEEQWLRSRTYGEATMWRETLHSLYNQIDTLTNGEQGVIEYDNTAEYY